MGEPLLFDYLITPDTCGSGGVGLTVINPQSGALPFSYDWGNGNIQASHENLIGGIYQLTITDSNGCENVEEFIVDSVSDLEVTVEASPIICAESSTAAATLIPLGGWELYQFSWNNGETTAEITNLSADISYAYTVTDAGGCIGVGSIIFEDTLYIIQIVETVNSPLCDGDLGMVTISAQGGVVIGPFTYAWNTGSSMEAIEVSEGSYTVTVTDVLGCTASSNIVVEEPQVLQISILYLIHPTVANDDRSISLIIEGGTQPYNVLWSNGGTGETIGQLSENTYSVTVIDANRCMDSMSFV